jgi:hypothetical protein
VGRLERRERASRERAGFAINLSRRKPRAIEGHLEVQGVLAAASVVWSKRFTSDSLNRSEKRDRGCQQKRALSSDRR